MREDESKNDCEFKVGCCFIHLSGGQTNVHRQQSDQVFVAKSAQIFAKKSHFLKKLCPKSATTK